MLRDIQLIGVWLTEIVYANDVGDLTVAWDSLLGGIQLGM